MVNGPLIRPYFLGGGTLGSHDLKQKHEQTILYRLNWNRTASTGINQSQLSKRNIMALLTAPTRNKGFNGWSYEGKVMANNPLIKALLFLVGGNLMG